MGDADGKILIDLSAPIIVDMEEGSQSGTITMEDIPVKALSARATRVTHVLDVYDGKLDAPLDFEAVKNVLASKAYSELPAPLAPKGRVPCEYTMQVVMRMPSEDRVEMVKHFTLKEGQSAGKINAFVQGKACTVDWGAQKDYRQARTTLLIMMSRIAGFRALCYEAGDAPLASEKEKKLLSKEDIERGFAFIEQEAPRSNFKNAALMWITIQENDPSSPIFWLAGGEDQGRYCESPGGDELGPHAVRLPAMLFRHVAFLPEDSGPRASFFAGEVVAPFRRTRHR